MAALRDFPPFYCLQPGRKLRQQYVDQWVALIVAQCLRSRQFEVAQDDPIFTNKAIKRTADPELVSEIFERMVQQQQAVYKDGKNAIVVQAISQAKCSQIIQDQLRRNYLDDDVFTIDEIVETLRGTALDGMPLEALVKGLEQLEREKQVELIRAERLEDMGVKVHLLQ